jgi:CRP-like cAMP-binding protein
MRYDTANERSHSGLFAEAARCTGRASMNFESARMRFRISAAVAFVCSIPWIFLWVPAILQPTVAAAAPMTCESLSSDGLLVEEIPSSTCMQNSFIGTSGINFITLHNRSNAMAGSLDDVDVNIQLPFPFRWFGALYDSVFVDSNSYVTFGGSAVLFSGFNPFNPPLPSLLIDAADNNLQLLTVARVPQGWLVHFEGSYGSVDDALDGNGNYRSKSSLVWELVFLSSGGLQLCTGTLIKDDFATRTSISAISNQKSSAFAHTFSLRSNILYSFKTTCAAANRVSLAAPVSSVSGTQLNVMLFLSANAMNLSTWSITLQGAGFACPPNSTVALVTSPPSLFAGGVANIVATNSSNPVLVMSGIIGTISGSTIMSFTVSGVSTPHQPQVATSGLGFSVHDINGRLVAGSNGVHLEAISPHVVLDQTLLLQLSVPTIRAPTTLQIFVSPLPGTFIPGRYALRSLVVTLTGAGWNFDAASVSLATPAEHLNYNWNPRSASISALGTAVHRIRVEFEPTIARTLSSLTPLAITLSPITTPQDIQGRRSDIKFGFLNARDSVVAAGDRGVMAAILASTMGSNAPVISFIPPLKSISNAVLDVQMTPVFRKNFKIIPSVTWPSSDPAIIITLSGQGISCPAGAPVTFLVPFTGATGTATIDNSVPMFPVLSVIIASGVFATDLPIWFQVDSVSTPLNEQPVFGNISAVLQGQDDAGATIVVAASCSGTMNRIGGDMGANMPFVEHTVASGIGRLSLSFTPSALLPSNSRIIVTLVGTGLTCAESTPVMFVSPPFTTSGKASFTNEPRFSVLVVPVPGVIAAGSNVSFSVAPVEGSFSSNVTLINVAASVVDGDGKILVASSSGYFTAAKSSALSVKDHISSATLGAILLPAGVFAGPANCDNVVNETMPSRALGSAVVLKSSGSGTLIDCSSTNMRCLVVYRSSITVIGVTFRGGASATVVLSSTVRTIQAMYNAAHATAFQPANSNAMKSSPDSRYEARRTIATDSLETSHSEEWFGGQARRRRYKGRQTPASRHSASAGKRQRRLHSTSVLSPMFSPDRQGCGGCLFVDAPGHNVSLIDVSFHGCRAEYGAGAFLNVLAFKAEGGTATNNVARQGGGMFVLSSVGSIIRFVTFVSNTVATFLPSGYGITPESSLGKFSLLPDPSAAAGGGAWFQLLGLAENCTFVDNTALAAGTADSEWGANVADEMAGAHALGSGMFVLETRRAALSLQDRPALIDLVFRRSQQLCAGWCVAGGAIFIGLTEGGTKISRIVFEGAESSAVSNEPLLALCFTSCVGPSVALGSCIVIVHMPSQQPSTIADVHAESIASKAIGSIYGGCITLLQNFLNSAVSNIFVAGATMISFGTTQNSIYGIFAANLAVNSSISNLVSETVKLQCIGALDPAIPINPGGIFGGILFVKTSTNLRLAALHTKYISLQSPAKIFGGIGCFIDSRGLGISGTSTTNAAMFITNPNVKDFQYFVQGGVFYIQTTWNVQIFNTSTLNINLSCRNTGDPSLQLRCYVLGGIIYSDLSDGINFSVSSTRNSELQCQTPNCEILGGVMFLRRSINTTVANMFLSGNSFLCIGARCLARGSVLYANALKSTQLLGINSANASVSCNGAGCSCSGGLFYSNKLEQTSQTPVGTNACSTCLADNLFSGIQSSGLFMQCEGEDCYVLGGIAYFEEAFCFTMAKVQVNNSVVTANGGNSKASGAVVGIAASNCSVFSGIHSTHSKLSANGKSCQALGGVMSLLSGSVSVVNCTFSQSTAQCSGVGCSAMGGFISAISTLVYNSNYNNFVTIDSSTFAFGAASCAGDGCSASGGAMASGASYRASIWIQRQTPSLSTGSPPQMQFTIRSCSFLNNSVSSFAVAASARGGALAVQFSVATVFNSTFSGNFITSGSSIAFAGGGAVHIAQANCILTAQNCSFQFNNASAAGQGGALLASVGATFVGSMLTVTHNFAGKGGGVLVDAAETRITNSEIQRNVAGLSGGGLFCSNNQANQFFATRGLAITGESTIALKNVTFRSNAVVDPAALGVGADLYIIGAVLFSADSTTEVLMNGNYDRDVTAAVVSVVTNSPNISMKLTCLSGTMLRIAPTSLSNLVSLSNPPSIASMSASKCFPACSEVPSYELYRATSGFLASCTPCPRGTYSFGLSTNTSDKVSTYCRPCPFGAICRGGDAIESQKMHWGWKNSKDSAASQFALLQGGYGCTNCSTITSCGGRRDGILCGGCEVGNSIAMFQRECVPSSQCEMWKAGVVVAMCVIYQLLFSLFLFWSVESELLNRKFESIVEKEAALHAIPLFQGLDPDQLRSACMNLSEEAVDPDTTVLSQGHHGDRMFIIRDGVFDVFIKPAEGIEKKVGELRAPQFFGELSFLGKAPCAATVRAATMCKVWAIDESCMPDVEDATVRSFVFERQSGYLSNMKHNVTAPFTKTSLYEAFDVLLWFYQLAGIMLTMSSPLDYLDGSSIAYSVVSFVLNSRPSSDSVSTLNSAATEASFRLDALSNNFAFCVHENTNAVHIFIATVLYYVCWAVIISILSTKNSWLHIRRCLVFLCRVFVWPMSRWERVRLYVAFLNDRLKESFQIQGAVLLRWGITCFSAITILMLQGTQCLRLRGIDAPGGELRWLYDGRVACFSTEGEVSGAWQFGSAVGVAIALLSPALLLVTMMRIEATDPKLRSELHTISFTAYSGPYLEGASHWTVVMYVPLKKTMRACE